MSGKAVKVEVVFGDDPYIVTVHISHRSAPIVAGLLGVDRDESGLISKVFLRQLIHSETDERQYEGWSMSGAISTILTRSAER